MKLEYYGHSCFKITTADGVSVLTDPFTKIGYELPPELSADLVVSSHEHFDHAYFDGVEFERKVISVGVDSYKGVKITGIESKHDERGGSLRGDNVIYVIEADGITLCHLGDLGETAVDEVCSRIADKIDILLVPVGGIYTIDAKTAKKFVDVLAPNIVVPMHFKTPDLSIEIDGVETFIELMKTTPTRVDGEFEFSPNELRKDTLLFTRKRS